MRAKIIPLTAAKAMKAAAESSVNSAGVVILLKETIT
jgi:hypothetical protein